MAKYEPVTGVRGTISLEGEDVPFDDMWWEGSTLVLHLERGEELRYPNAFPQRVATVDHTAGDIHVTELELDFKAVEV